MSSFSNIPISFGDGYNPPPIPTAKNQASLSHLPSAVWSCILSYLNHSDMRNLMLLNHAIKQQIQPHLYMELTLTEWASSGARLARAIQRGTVSDETCSCIRRLRIIFTSLDEIREVLQICLQIHPRMTSVDVVDVEAHKTDDMYYVVHRLSSKYNNCVFNASARAPAYDLINAESPSLSPIVLPMISCLRIPRLYHREIQWLHSITSLTIDEVVQDGSQVTLPKNHIINHLALSYEVYEALGSPSATMLEISLSNNVRELIINDSACKMLRLVAHTDIPQIEPHIRCPSLKALILCNFAPLPTIKLAELNNIDTVEFLSIAPVTIPALQAIASKKFLPSLQLVLTMVTRTSFLSPTATLRKREARKLVEWLQVIASTYPVDVRDFSRLLRDDIYFSDGLWCLAAQTRYREYLAYVAPPPLKVL